MTKEHQDIVNNALAEIGTANQSKLRDVDFLVDVIRKIGLYDDGRKLYGDDNAYISPFAYPKEKCVKYGLWQVPRQLAELCVYLSDKQINSFLEIGTFQGFTTLFLCAYLRQFNPTMSFTTCDITPDFMPGYVVEKMKEFKIIFVQGDSELIIDSGGQFDACLIDGDHHLDSVQMDCFYMLEASCGYIAFHDVNDKEVEEDTILLGGVPAAWAIFRINLVKQNFHEFLYHSHGERVMGIGVMEKIKF